MLLAYPEFNTRRSIYAVLLFLSVLGPAVLIALAMKSTTSDGILIAALLVTLLGIPLLCIWCAIYVYDEPGRVRIALTWIAALFLFIGFYGLTHNSVS